MGTLREIAIGVIIGFFSNMIWMVVGSLLSHFGGFDIFDVKIPFWIMIFIILMVIPIVAMFVRSRYISKIEVVVGKSRPRDPRHTRTFEINHFGVKWKILYYDDPLSLRKPYAFADGGPYCPNCDYEMRTEKRGIIMKKYFWICDRCDKSYKCPTKSPYEASEIVEKLLESEIRSGKLQ